MDFAKAKRELEAELRTEFSPAITEKELSAFTEDYGDTKVDITFSRRWLAWKVQTIRDKYGAIRR